ncbi:MAG: hypothetical protein WBX25_00280 [Rhodomicrobium sp.]
MPKISPEMDAILTHAEKNGLCLWQVDPADPNDNDEATDAWVDLLWDPSEVRQAIIGYTPQVFRHDMTHHSRWQIVDPRILYQNLKVEAEFAMQRAEEFKKSWIDKTQPLQKRVLRNF